jgi:hypothetical protein
MLLMTGVQSTDINIVSNGLILILPLPIYNYLFNIAKKIVQKEKITSDDFYFFNESVINNVNLHRITYILTINYIVMYHYFIYITTIVILIIIFSIILGCYIVNIKLNRRTTVDLECGTSPTLKCAGSEAMSIITAFVGIAPILQEACNIGYMHYYTNTGGDKFVYWNNEKLGFINSSEHYLGNKTINILRKEKTTSLYLKLEPEYKGIVEEHRAKLKNSPILNMAYIQKNNRATYDSNLEWNIKPISYFSHKDFYGSISETQKGRFLIINIIRGDSNGSIFMPSFYLPDGTTENQAKIRDVYSVLSLKYNIMLPVGPFLQNGCVIFTQAESLGANGLFRLWRPSIQYIEPESIKRISTVSSYYKLTEGSMVRLPDYNYNKLPKKTGICDLKKLVTHNCTSSVKIKYPISVKQGVSNEIRADRIYRGILNSFLNRGRFNKENNYGVIPEESKDDYKDRLTIASLLKKIDYQMKKKAHTMAKGKWREIDTLYDGEPLSVVMDRLKISLGENELAGFTRDSTYWNLRRLSSVDISLWKKDLSLSTYVSLYKHGVIQGFQNSNNLLGGLNEEFILQLNESREDLISKIGKKYKSGGVNDVVKLKSIYGISINRLTFEFFEVRPNSNIFGYMPERHIKSDDCEVYSIIDTFNDSSKFITNLGCGGKYPTIIPKHDYHFLDNKDEHSIRKFMDFFYQNDNGSLTYKSNIANKLDNQEVLNLRDKPIKVLKAGKVRNSYLDKFIFKKNSIKWEFQPDTSVNFGLNKKTNISSEWLNPDLDIWPNSCYFNPKKWGDISMDPVQDSRLIRLKTNLKFNGFLMIEPKLPDKLIPKCMHLPTIEEEEEIDFLGDDERFALKDINILRRNGRLINPQEKALKGVYRHNQLWGVGGAYDKNYLQPVIDRLGVGLMELIDEKLERANSRVEARYKELGEQRLEKPAFKKLLSEYYKEVRAINGTDISNWDGPDETPMHLPDEINIYDAYDDADEMDLVDQTGVYPGFEDEMRLLEEQLLTQFNETYEDENVDWDDDGFNFDYDGFNFNDEAVEEVTLYGSTAPKRKRG